MIVRGKVARYILHVLERFQTSLPTIHKLLVHARVEGHDKVGLCLFFGRCFSVNSSQSYFSGSTLHGNRETFMKKKRLWK